LPHMRGMERLTLFGPLERDNVDHWTNYVNIAIATYTPAFGGFSRTDDRTREGIQTLSNPECYTLLRIY
jgi:hypothetical protein